MPRSSNSQQLSSRRSGTTVSDALLEIEQIRREFVTSSLAPTALSLPSAPAIVVETQNPQYLTAEFAYNFFEPTELRLQSAAISEQAEFGSVDTNRLSLLPRYVKLSWAGVDQNNLSTSDAASLSISISENRHLILAENDMAIAKLFVDYSQQELDFVSNARTILGRLYSEINSLNTATSDTDIKPTMQQAISGLYNATPEGVDQQFVSKYLSYGSSEVMVGSDRLNSPVLNQSLESVYENEDVGVGISLSSTVAGSLLASLYCADPLSDKSANAADSVARSVGFQAALGTARPRFNLSQYGIGDAIKDKIISYEQLDSDLPPGSPLPQLTFRTIGYIVEKRRAVTGTTDQPNPTLVLDEPEVFYVENPTQTELYDRNVAYNQTYYYSVKSVTAFRAYVTDSTTAKNFAVTFMVSSEPARTFVQCVDNRSPTPPTDFFVSMDLNNSNKPMLTWNFPVDTRRHIKYFQVFRRKNRGPYRPVQLPFELVAMYDFNDIQGGQGVVFDKVYDTNYFRFMLPGTENAMAKTSVIDLLAQSSNSNGGRQRTSTMYIDDEFNTQDYYIYAVAAVDAHGQSSCYSNQIGVKFNRERNTIERVDISPPGAPKTYPNLLIDKQVFVDTIKNEGYSQVTLVLNPDFLELNNIQGDDLSLIKTKESGGQYIMKLINLDLQKDQTLKFEVLDTRTAG